MSTEQRGTLDAIHGLPLPAAAYAMSPYADLTLAGTNESRSAPRIRRSRLSN